MDGVTNDRFAYHVDISSDGSTIGIGSAFGDGNNTDSGSVYVYKMERSKLIERFLMIDDSGSEILRVNPVEEHYIVNWHTKEYNLTGETTYRIRVSVNNHELGYADVEVVTSGKELKNVVSGEYVALKDGRTLPIKFRLEEGWETPGEYTVPFYYDFLWLEENGYLGDLYDSFIGTEDGLFITNTGHYNSDLVLPEFEGGDLPLTVFYEYRTTINPDSSASMKLYVLNDVWEGYMLAIFGPNEPNGQVEGALYRAVDSGDPRGPSIEWLSTTFLGRVFIPTTIVLGEDFVVSVRLFFGVHGRIRATLEYEGEPYVINESDGQRYTHFDMPGIRAAGRDGSISYLAISHEDEVE